MKLLLVLPLAAAIPMGKEEKTGDRAPRYGYRPYGGYYSGRPEDKETQPENTDPQERALFKNSNENEDDINDPQGRWYGYRKNSSNEDEDDNDDPQGRLYGYNAYGKNSPNQDEDDNDDPQSRNFPLGPCMDHDFSTGPCMTADGLMDENGYYLSKRQLGNLNPMVIMHLMDENNDMDDMTKLMLLSGQQGTFADGDNAPMNPFVMALLFGKNGGDKDKLMPFLLMSQMGNNNGQNNQGGFDPIMWMMMNKNDGGDDNFMKMMLLSNMNNADGNNNGFNPMMWMLMNQD